MDTFHSKLADQEKLKSLVHDKNYRFDLLKTFH